ncbi:MAG TPA: cytochrome c [Chitinophagaceae bacterium]|nr:cytochrome c [Chitinophagaceae bacterium]
MRKLIVVLVTASFCMSFIGVQPSLQASITRGKKVYDTYCMPCHMVDGGGVPRMNPPLIKTVYVLGDKKRLIGIVLNGLDEPLEIDGETYSNVMASHAFLKDQEIADVLTYVRNSFGNKATMITPEEVKALREEKK